MNRLTLLCAALAAVAPLWTDAQPASSRGRPSLGFYAGLVSEVGRFDGHRVRAAEEESGRIRVWTPGAPPFTPGGSSTQSRTLGSSSTMLIEPAVRVGVALGPIFRIDARAGARLGRSVEVAGRSISTSGGFVGVTWALGWLGDWRMAHR